MALHCGVSQQATAQYRNCDLQFGFGKSTVKFIYSEFEQAIFELKERFIQFPFTNQEIREKIEEFEECFLIVSSKRCSNLDLRVHFGFFAGNALSWQQSSLLELQLKSFTSEIGLQCT